MSNLSKNDPQNIEQNFDELELVAEKAGELNDRVGKIESELGAQTKTLESAALVLDAAIKGLGALKSSVLENDIGALQLALNDKTAHLAREIGRFESAVAEIDRRAESGDDEIKAALLATAQSLRAQFDAKSAEIGEWSARVEKEIAAHAVALAAIPPIIKGADAVGFNPVGEWETGKAFARMDVVSYAGSSYISNVDGNTEKPSKSKNYTVLSKRAGSIGSGGVGGFAELTGTILPAQVVPGSATYAVGDVLYAGTTGALSKLGAGSSGQLLSTQGAGAAPIWVTATGGAGDMNGPASATDNAIVRFDGTGGKTVQNSAVTIADTTGAIAGASSLAAPASTDLTLTGGSTGASLVLGQGATAGAATLASTGTGNAKVGFSAASGAYASLGVSSASATDGPFILVRGKDEASSEGWVQIVTNSSNASASSGSLQVNQYNGTSFNEVLRTTKLRNLLIGTTTDRGAKLQAANGAAAGSSVPTTFGVISSGTDGANIIAAADGNMTVTINARSTQGYGSINTYNYGTSAAFPLVVQGNGGNLLLGTTTDAASLSGGLVVNGSGTGAVATGANNNTGALRVTGGVGVSGAGYFGGVLNVTGAATFAGGTLTLAPAAAEATITAKGRATGTNPLATTSRGGVLALTNLDTTDNNAEAITFQNSNDLAVASIVAQNVSHTGRTGKLYFNVSNGAAPAEAFSIAPTLAATFAGAVSIGNTVGTAAAVASTHKVTMVIGGVTYYLLATNVP